MKVSEAIRKGSQVTSQVFGKVKGRKSTCAMGADYNAIGVKSVNEVTIAVNVAIGWQWLHNTSADCPFCGQKGTVISMIIHLNDFHKWEREKIANRIENIENSLNESQAPIALADANVLTNK